MTPRRRGLARPGALVIVGGLVLLACACGAPPPRPPPQLPAAAQLDPPLRAALAALEERLLIGEASVRFWSEMRARHESVSAIATVAQERHAGAIALFEDRQRGKADAFAKKNRVAARYVPGTQAAR